MYFLNQQHKRNFYQLISENRIGQTNSQFCAGFYIIALPEIFNHCNGNPMSDDQSPFDWYFEELEQYGKIIGLPYAHEQLAKAGLCLYNNHKHDDSYDDFNLFLAVGSWNQDLFHVFVQACEIKRDFTTAKKLLLI